LNIKEKELKEAVAIDDLDDSGLIQYFLFHHIFLVKVIFLHFLKQLKKKI
jgi:hypothetical protein